MLMPSEINRETDKLAAWNNNPESGVLQVIYLFFFLRLHLSFQPDIYLLLQSSSNPLFMCIVIIPLKFLNFQFQPFGTRRLVEHKNQRERDTLPWQQFNLPRRNFIRNFLFLFLRSSCLHATGNVGDRRTLAPIPALARGSSKKKKKWDSMDGWDIEKWHKKWSAQLGDTLGLD